MKWIRKKYVYVKGSIEEDVINLKKIKSKQLDKREMTIKFELTSYFKTS